MFGLWRYEWLQLKSSIPAMKRCVIIHGWDGNPQEGWFPWLKQQLEIQGVAVSVPQMPHADHPTIDDWVTTLAEVISTPDEELVLVGHSMGCQTIWRYLQALPEGKIISGMVLVAPFVRLKPIIFEEPGVPEIFQPWFDSPLHWDVIRSHTKNTFVLLSDNDQYVYHEDASMFEQELSAKTKVMHDMGHFSGSNGITELPEVRDAILSFF